VAGGRRGSTSVYRHPGSQARDASPVTSVNRDRRHVDGSYLVAQGTLLSRRWESILIADTTTSATDSATSTTTGCGYSLFVA
jgi:hypothetical protein